MSLRLFIMRHGETEWSLSGQHTGRADIPLTENGKAEAKKIGVRISEIDFANILVSPLKRAMQTCDLAGLGERAKVEADLAEWDNGDYEGRTGSEILESRPGWNLFHDGCPNGESLLQISNRVDRLIDSLKEMDGNVALFTHGHLGRVLAARWIGVRVELAQHFLLDTASLSILCFQHDQQDQPAIQLWNSTSLEILGSKPARLQSDRTQLETALSPRVALERWENEGGEVLSGVTGRAGMLRFHSSIASKLNEVAEQNAKETKHSE